MPVLLDVKNLITQFYTENGVVKAVGGISYHVNEREVIGIVGESGCGKSVSQLSTMQLIPKPPGEIVGGEIWFDGINLLDYEVNGPEMRDIRGSDIAMIFQEPMTSLNPTMTIGDQITESIQLHLGYNKEKARERAVELLTKVKIPDARERLDEFPHRFSGGMRQRVMIAMALSCNPKILIADEPTTALDVTTQAQLLELMAELVHEFDTSLIIVTHNLGVVARFADRIYVMYAGKIVEGGPTDEIFANPCHPYTRGLVGAVPRLDEKERKKLIPIEGLPPSLINLPSKCAFLPRCLFASEQCRTNKFPDLVSINKKHQVACYEHLDGVSVDNAHETIPALNIQIAPKENTALAGTEHVIQEGNLVEVNDLKMHFPIRKGILQRQTSSVKAVDGVSFSINHGETFGLVGESGCGKTTTGKCVIRLLEPTGGQVIFDGTDITHLPEKKLISIRQNISLVFQDPHGSLDPRQTAGSIVGEPLKVLDLTEGKSEYQDRVEQLFKMVGLNPDMQNRVPHEFSGGQRQRLAIARALASNPSLIVCDEPISALDVSIQAQIINLLQDLQDEIEGLTYLFVAHDLSVVRHISDRVAVMYLGRIVETADANSLYYDPQHTYTKALLSAIPIPDPIVERTRQRIELPGEVPSPMDPPRGCSFHTRCPNATGECYNVIPELRDMGHGHWVSCHRK